MLRELCAQTSSIWERLSGDHRAFECIDSVLPSFTKNLTYEFNIQMDDGSGTQELCLFISSSAALVLSAYMFDMPSDQLQQSEIDDACGELCNIVAGLLSLNGKIVKFGPAARNTESRPEVGEWRASTHEYIGVSNAAHQIVFAYGPQSIPRKMPS